MTDLILRIFVRDHKNTEDPAVRDKCGRVAGAVGTSQIFCLFLMKISSARFFTVFPSRPMPSTTSQIPARPLSRSRI